MQLMDEAEIAELPPVVTIHVSVPQAINYASWQNAVPFLRMLRIENATETHYSDLKLELDMTPSFARRRVWTIDRLQAGSDVVLTDRLVELDPDYLSGLDEAERGLARFRLTTKGEVIAEANIDVRLLSRDEWGGFQSMGVLLAAFVMPNDPAVATILKEASRILGQHGHPTGLDGYQSEDPGRAYMLAASLWSAVSAKRLTYAEPPKSFEKAGQKVRRPTTIIEQGLATCLDTALLFASAAEAAGLNPVVLLVDGHALAGVWLVNRNFPNLLETDISEVRKAVVGRELILFETTAVTQNPPAMFDDAIRIAGVRLREDREEEFVAAIDVSRARSSQIRPLASHVRIAEPVGPGETHEAVPLPKAFNVASFPQLETEVKPSTPKDRIDRWQRKLLDLSLRNRLLNFKDGTGSVPFVCPDVPFFEDRLAADARMRIISLPEQNPRAGRDAELLLNQTGRELDSEFSLKALQRDELAAPLAAKDMAARLTDLYRRAQSDLAEGGSNTLFMAIGFLRWKKTPEDTKAYRAPLLLLPVKLERRSASSSFSLLHHEDDPRFNATLAEFLRRDFEIILPGFEQGLPKDDSGIDVPLVLEMIRRAVRDVAGFEVVNEIALSTFSFAKYLMWKDLVERTDALRQSPIVRHLIDSPEQVFSDPSRTDFVQADAVDKTYEPKDLLLPLPADSSQISAVMAAAAGKNFVLIGPPGTGKSQTIANMIAQCLASSKTVLFVAEKTAALDVVYRRLRQNGLGDYCLELHSNKAERKQFIDQLKTSWTAQGAATDAEWVSVNESLKITRDQLNAYVEAIHAKGTDGLSAYELLGIEVAAKHLASPALDWDPGRRIDARTLGAFLSLCDELGRTFMAVQPVPAILHVKRNEWSAGWETSLLEGARNLQNSIKPLRQSISGFAAEAGLGERSDGPVGMLSDLKTLAEAIRSIPPGDYKVLLHQDFTAFRQSIDAVATAILEFRQAADALTAIYTEDDLDRIPIDELDMKWRAAKAAIWPAAQIKKSEVRKFLATFTVNGKPDPDQDLPLLRVMRERLVLVRGSALKDAYPGWAGLKTDVEAMRAHFASAARLRETVLLAGKIAGAAQPVINAMRPYIRDGQENHPLRAGAGQYLQSLAGFWGALKAYMDCAGGRPDGLEGAACLSALDVELADLAACRPKLQTWTAWCNIREKARAHGFGNFVAALEAGDFAVGDLRHRFMLAYARRRVPEVIDGNDILRSFQRYRHEDLLAEFRNLDDKVRHMAAREVRRRIKRDLPKPDMVPRQSELGLLRHQMTLQRPSKSIREMIAGLPEAFPKLSPCILMSPLSIAQYLPANQQLFDIVIFDEASQIATWDAVGALARGRQAVVVGDPKQLPPTNFFGKTEADDPEVNDYEKDLESILDEASASGISTQHLDWHYRSRHESLIAFSNWHYYANRLITFPSPVTEDRAVSFRHITQGVYDRGKSRTNAAEAEAIAEEGTKRMLDWLKLPEQARPTLGIVTFNSQQQTRIEDLLDAKRRQHTELEWFFSRDRIEPTIVKNLENVQGDERDVMLFSITFATDQAGALTQNFGAINREGGERRLNVAVTRAREELVVFSSILPDQIKIDGGKSRGVKDLKTFLDFAMRGAIALPATDRGSEGGFESVFEEAVAEVLENNGWQVVPQIGVSQFRIDLGIVHPDRPGTYLAGVECDGATYHSSATARDRDKIREQVLNGLGWQLVRVWSPDWWYNKDGAAQRLLESLTALLDADRARRDEAEALAQQAAEQARHEVEQASEVAAAFSPDSMFGTVEPSAEEGLPLGELAEPPAPAFLLPEPANDTTPSIDREQLVAGLVPITPNSDVPSVPAAMPGLIPTGDDKSALFRRTDLSGFSANADRFFEPGYRGTLRDMVAHVIDTEAPVRDDVVAQRIARGHGWLRTGSRIRDAIDPHFRKYPKTPDGDGGFLWTEGGIRPWVAYRAAATEDDRRSVADIAIEELVGLVMANEALLKLADPALAMARVMGLERLVTSSRARIDEAIARYRAIKKE